MRRQSYDRDRYVRPSGEKWSRKDDVDEGNCDVVAGLRRRSIRVRKKCPAGEGDPKDGRVSPAGILHVS